MYKGDIFKGEKKVCNDELCRVLLSLGNPEEKKKIVIRSRRK